MQARCVGIRGAYGGHNDIIPEKLFNIARGPMAGKGETVMKNIKSLINQIAKEARNLDLTYNDQTTVVKVVKALYVGDNALAFALLVTNEKLLPLLGIWSQATAEDKPSKLKLTREQFMARIAKATRQLHLNRDERIIAANALNAVCAGDTSSALRLLNTNDTLRALVWDWHIM